MNLFGVLAGALVGVGLTNMWHPRKALGAAGTLGVFLAAAAAALLVPAVATRVDDQVLDAFDLAAAAPMLHRVLLIAAVAAWCVHLLDELAADVRLVRGMVAAVVLAEAAMIWQWLAAVADPTAGILADQRWYHLAYAVGIGVPQLLVLVVAARYRRAGGWPKLLVAGAVAGLAWTAVVLLLAFAPEAAASLPGWAVWLLMAIAAGLYWAGSIGARSDSPEFFEAEEDEAGDQQNAAEEEVDEAEYELAEQEHAEEEQEAALPAAAAPVALAEVAVAPSPSRVIAPPEVAPDPAEVQRRAAGVAVALAQQLEKSGRSNAVAVGACSGELVFSTADGLGYLPEGGSGAADLVPLISSGTVDDEFRDKWLGCAHPQMPLLAAAELGLIPPLQALVTVNAEGTIAGVELEDGEEIDAAELRAPRSRTDAVPISDVHNVLSGLQRDWSIEPGTPTLERAAQAASARWTTWPNEQYKKLWVAELAARATDYLQTGDIDSAQYCLAAASRIPKPAASSPSNGDYVPIDGGSRHAIGSQPGEYFAAGTPRADSFGTSQDTDYVDVATDDAHAGVPPAAASGPVPEPPAPAPLLSASIVAALVDQIPGSAEIAVAVAADGTAVFATSDGLGHLPAGAHAANNVVPLAMGVDEAFAAQWLGCDAPHRPLLDAIERGLIPPATELATTSQAITAPGVTSIDLDALPKTPRVPLTRPREQFGPIVVDDVAEVLAELTAHLGDPAEDLDQAWAAAEALRWPTHRDPRYTEAWIRYLHAAAAAAARAGDIESARYLLGSGLIATTRV